MSGIIEAAMHANNFWAGVVVGGVTVLPPVLLFYDRHIVKIHTARIEELKSILKASDDKCQEKIKSLEDRIRKLEDERLAEARNRRQGDV